jgi:hypothetical protein
VAAEAAPVTSREPRPCGNLSDMGAFLRFTKRNPVDQEEIGHIGDVNWLEYGGGPVYKTEHGYAVEHVEPPEDGVDFDSPKARWTIHRVDLDQEVPSWGDVKSVARSAGQSSKELRNAFISDDPMVRA